jgi:hypothetical protein
MSNYYHPEATFTDPVFGALRGSEIGAMWRMLCARAEDLEITFDVGHADANSATAHWEARYTFGRTGRYVYNAIDATFKFQEGRIIEHIDRFNLWRWTRMALGPLGFFLGWTSFVQDRVRKEARRGLDAFIQKQSNKDAGS